MPQLELPKRIWSLDAATLIEMGADVKSIHMHAEVELEEELENLAKLSAAKADIDKKAIEEAIRVRHRMHWAQFSKG